MAQICEPNHDPRANEGSTLLEIRERIDDIGEQIQEGVEDLAERISDGKEVIADFWVDFRSFVNQQSIIELAVGVIVGAAFGDLLNSLVEDILSPPLAFLNHDGSTLRNYFFVLKHGQTANMTYVTLAEAKADGATTENVGLFFERVLKFTTTAFALYWLIKAYTHFLRMLAPKRATPVPDVATKTVPYISSSVSGALVICIWKLLNVQVVDL